MSTTPLHTSSNGGGGQDGLSPTSMDAQQQQHLLKQHQQHQHPHQQPFTNSLRARNDDHATRGREHTTLTRHPSGTPGPSYPFPSQTESGRPQGMGRFMQGVLKPFRRCGVMEMGANQGCCSSSWERTAQAVVLLWCKHCMFLG